MITSDFKYIFHFYFFKYKNVLKFKRNQTYFVREATAIKWLPSIADEFG